MQSHKRDQSLHGLLFLTLTKNLIFKDLYVLTRTGCTIINQKLVDSMFVPGAVAIQK